MKINLEKKIQIRTLTMLKRINFIAWSTFLVGTLIVLTFVAIYFIFPDFPFSQTEKLIVGLIGLIVATIGIWMINQVRILRNKVNDISTLDKKLMILTFVTLVVGLVVATPFILSGVFATGGFFVFGIVLLFIFALLALDIIRFRSLIWRTKNNPQEIVESSKPALTKAWRLIYPKIKHDKAWHRAITVIGWLVSIFSYFILFPIYFGIIQRLIYFIAYGDKKDKWLIEEIK